MTLIFHTVTSQDLSGEHHLLQELDLSRVCKDTLDLGLLDTAVCVTRGGKEKAPPHLSAPPKGGIAFESMSIVYGSAWELLGVGWRWQGHFTARTSSWYLPHLERGGLGVRVVFVHVYLIWSHSLWNTAMSLPWSLFSLNKHVCSSLFLGSISVAFLIAVTKLPVKAT